VSTPTYFGIKVPSTGSFSATNARKSNKYYRHYSSTNIHHKVQSFIMLKFKLHVHIAAILKSHNDKAALLHIYNQYTSWAVYTNIHSNKWSKGSRPAEACDVTRVRLYSILSDWKCFLWFFYCKAIGEFCRFLNMWTSTTFLQQCSQRLTRTLTIYYIIQIFIPIFVTSFQFLTSTSAI